MLYSKVNQALFTQAMYNAQTGKKLSADEARALVTELDARRVKIQALEKRQGPESGNTAPAVELEREAGAS